MAPQRRDVGRSVAWAALLVLLLVVGARRGMRPRQPGAVWLVATGDAIRVAPATDGERVFIASADRHVYALEAATGRLVWDVELTWPASADLLLSHGRLVVGGGDGQVVALAAVSGSRLWRTAVGAPAAHGLAPSDGLAVVLTDAGVLTGLDLADGRPAWRLRLPQPPTGGPLAVADGGLLLTYADGHVEARHGDGRLRWSSAVAKVAVRMPSARGDRAWVAADDGKLCGLDLATGRETHTVDLGSPAVAPPLLGADRLWVATCDDHAFGVPLTGQLAWSVELPARVEARPARLGDQVVLVGEDRCLHAFDAQTGRRAWRLHARADITADLVSDGARLYFGTWAGEAGALRLR